MRIWFLKSVAWAATLAAILEPVLGAEQGDKVIVLPLKQRVTPQLNKRQSTNTERLFNDNTVSYQIDIGIGTPPQFFNVTLDTGSPYLWVPSTSCPDTQCPVKKFDGAASSTFNQTNIPFRAKYGIGEADGTYAWETVTVGSLTVVNQAFGVVSSTIDFLSPSSSSSGILGLSFPLDGELPFVFNLVEHNLIARPIFSIFLNSRLESGYSGEIMFGGIDNSKYQGGISYFTVPRYNIRTSTMESAQAYVYWTVAGSSITTTTGFSVEFLSLQRMVLDTGTTFSLGPESVVSAIANAITNNQALLDTSRGWYFVSCSFRGSTDYVVFNFEESFSVNERRPTKVAIPVSQLILQADVTGQYCVFGLQPMIDTEANGFDWVLGQSFLRSVYAVHDMANARVGLASVPGLGIVTPADATNTTETPPAPSPSAADSPSQPVGEGSSISLSSVVTTQFSIVLLVSILFLAF